METALITRTLLVKDTLLLSVLRAAARRALANARVTAVLDTPSGEPGASLAVVDIDPADFATILLADNFATGHSESAPEIAVTEFDATGAVG